MISLRELQQRVYRAIVLEEDVDLPVEDGTPQRKAARLGVYRNNARETFRRTLAETYPVVARLVGDACFRGLGCAYMRDFPSRSGDLGSFGAEFDTLLDICYRDTTFTYLADVACLEWACARAETAVDAAPLDLLELRAIPPHRYPELGFAFHPSCGFVSSRYPVLSIWEANQAEQAPSLSLGLGGECVLIFRRDGQVHLDRLDAGTFAFASALAAGETLLDAQETGLATTADFDSSRALTALAGLGVLTACRLDPKGIDC